jgi:hypothetical protein
VCHHPLGGELKTCDDYLICVKRSGGASRIDYNNVVTVTGEFGLAKGWYRGFVTLEAEMPSPWLIWGTPRDRNRRRLMRLQRVKKLVALISEIEYERGTLNRGLVWAWRVIFKAKNGRI